MRFYFFQQKDATDCGPACLRMEQDINSSLYKTMQEQGVYNPCRWMEPLITSLPEPEHVEGLGREVKAKQVVSDVVINGKKQHSLILKTFKT